MDLISLIALQYVTWRDVIYDNFRSTPPFSFGSLKPLVHRFHFYNYVIYSASDPIMLLITFFIFQLRGFLLNIQTLGGYRKSVPHLRLHLRSRAKTLTLMYVTSVFYFHPNVSPSKYYVAFGQSSSYLSRGNRFFRKPCLPRRWKKTSPSPPKYCCQW